MTMIIAFGAYLSLATLLGAGNDARLMPLRTDTQLTGFARGTAAIGVDPAALGTARSGAVQLRWRITPEDSAPEGDLGFYGIMPLGDLTLAGNLDIVNIRGGRYRRAGLSVALPLFEGLYVGMSPQWFSSGNGQVRGTSWDASIFAELGRWGSASIVARHFNRPRLFETQRKPSYETGVAIRPLGGSPLLTLAAQAYYAPQDTTPFGFGGAALELRPISGITLELAYRRTSITPTEQQDVFWFGLALGLGHGEIRSGASVGTNTTVYSSITIEGQRSPTFLNRAKRTIQMQIEGTLTTDSELGLATAKMLQGPDMVSLLAYRIESLASAQKRNSIGTLILNIGNIKVGLAQVQELRTAIQLVRAAGITVIARMTSVDDKGYLVAAACSEIEMDPAASLNIDGFSMRSYFIADTLKILGIRFDAVAIGDYKTGPDPLTRNSSRPEGREVRDIILTQAHSTLVASLVHDRQLESQKAKDIIDQGVLTAQAAIEAGLVDRLSITMDENNVPTTPEYGFDWDSTETVDTAWGHSPIISVVPIVGTIVMRDTDNPLPGNSAEAASIVPALEQAGSDSRVAAVVVRINSPGGDVYASELIWRAIRKLQVIKPVVISMGDVAASGGYYAAVAGNRIFAQPNTITGSIGIFSLHADISSLLETLEVGVEHSKRGKYAGWQDTSHALSVEAKRTLKALLRSYYDDFVGKVASGRGLSKDAAFALAQGRVYTGVEAKALKLIDEFGGLTDAIRAAKTLADIGAYTEVRLHVPHQETRLMDLITGTQNAHALNLMQMASDMNQRIKIWNHKPLALMPDSLPLDVGMGQ